jgi:hypothetical protein
MSGAPRIGFAKADNRHQQCDDKVLNQRRVPTESIVRPRQRADMRFFFFMPKTAGGAIATGIRANVRAQWPLDPYYPSPKALAPPSSDQIWLGGHTAYGLHLIYNAEPVYMTILREPVERLISEFFYHHRHPLPGIFIPDDELLPAFIRIVEAATHLNFYSYMFSDYCFVKESIEANQGEGNSDTDTALDLLRRRERRLGFLAENIPFHSVDIDDSFQKASSNILSMRFVGFFDRLDDTAAYLRDEFGLKVSLKTRIHKTRWKPRAKDLPGHIQTMLIRKTEADRDIFSFARDRWLRRTPRETSSGLQWDGIRRLIGWTSQLKRTAQ